MYVCMYVCMYVLLALNSWIPALDSWHRGGRNKPTSPHPQMGPNDPMA